MNIKTDCFAYDAECGCKALKELYCEKEECKFYNNTLSWEKIEKELKKSQK